MKFDEDSPKTLETSTKRHKCAACFKQYKKKEHLFEHVKTSHHSVHEPRCGICQRHCKSFESLREHTTGPLAKGDCSESFAERGCKLCMRIFNSPVALDEHHQICFQPAPVPLGAMPCTESQLYDPPANSDLSGRPEAVAIACEMVGCGSDGSLNLCARVCLIDEDEKLIFHTYVQPQIPVTDYRYELTGITEDHMRDAMPLEEVEEKILKILYNGESIWRLRLNGGKARVLVGHGIEHHLDRLKMNYPNHMLRDTAEYPPLMKTNPVSHSLKYLVKTYLGYEIQSGMHDLYEDCVSVMRLYKRLRSEKHPAQGRDLPLATRGLMNGYDSLNKKEIENMTPDELLDFSKSKYKCWCLD